MVTDDKSGKKLPSHSTGPAGRFWQGGCRTPTMRASARRRLRRRWRSSAGPRFSTPTKARSSPRPPSPVPRRRRCRHLHGRSRPLDGQRLDRTALAVAEIRGCLPQGLCRRSRCPARHRFKGRKRSRTNATVSQWRETQRSVPERF
jgi:hypothetical protein